MPGTALAPKPAEPEPRERPAWLVALDGLCRPCADAEFYGVRKQHTACERGGCRCAYVIPEVWPAGTWGA
jgi:hypothetical protein